MFVIPGQDQGPHASDKHQTRIKGLRIELSSRKLKDIVFFSSLVQARDDGLWERPCVKIAELVICIASTTLTAMQATPQCINVRHPWQGPGTLCQRQALNLVQRIESRTVLMKAILLLDPWSKPGMTALQKAVYESCRTRYLHSINNADCNAGDATMSQCSSSLARTRDLMPATRTKHTIRNYQHILHLQSSIVISAT